MQCTRFTRFNSDAAAVPFRRSRPFEHVPRDVLWQLGNLYLLTLASTVPFYEKNGFSTIPSDDAPKVLRAERAVGSALQSFFGNSVVCMQARC